MWRTRAGYAGGTREDPIYLRLGDHTEMVQVDFDPRTISYRELLDVFWVSHNPWVKVASHQYRSLVLYHDQQQREQAEASKAFQAQEAMRPVQTEVRPLERFYRAEDYHQKYFLQAHSAVFREYHYMYSNFGSLVDSTAAARVNGYLAGFGRPEQWQREQEQLGLSPAIREEISRLTGKLL